MIRFAIDLASTLTNTRSVTIISYNISFTIYLSRHFFHLHAASRRAGNGKAPLHAMYMWTCLLLAPGLFGFEPFHICFPLLSYCIAMQKRILNQTMMSTMVSECPVLNPHILRRASVIVGRLFGDVPSGDIPFFSSLSPLQSFHGCICVILGNHSDDRGCCIGFWVQVM